MHKNIDVLFLLFVVVFLCVILPLRCTNRRIAFLKQNQFSYEADYLAWEIQTFRRIDSTVLPSAAIEFHCYDRNMEQAALLVSADDTKYEALDFTPYFCVIFTCNGEKRGVCIE